MFVSDPHPSFPNVPEEDAVLWRYMDLGRFLSLLEDEAIYFARADQMSDKWEGAYTHVNRELNKLLYEGYFGVLDGALFKRRAFMLKTTHISCWHESPNESAAMWDLYPRDGRGVAIKTSWGDLKASLGSERWISGRRIRYADYASESIPEDNVFDAFMHKRRSFEHEREVRLITSTPRTDVRFHDELQRMQAYYDSEPVVIPVPVDLVRLIDSVYVAPESPGWIFDLIAKIVKRYGFAFEVRQSDLAADPVS